MTQIPVTLITGFLGAGKTTIISNLIQEIGGDTRLAVVVNEFGEVSIDDGIIRQSSAHAPHEVHKLTRGLLAYNRQDEFLATMLSIWERNRLIDHVIIETSGLAAPTAALEVLQSQDLCDKYVLDSNIVVIDVPRFINDGNDRNDSDTSELLVHQLRCADVVALNKIDSLTEDSLLEVEARIRKQYPRVRFLEFARQGRMEPAVALGLRLNQPAASLVAQHVSTSADSAAKIADNAANIYEGHSHSDLGAHEHGIFTHEHIHEHDPGWISFVLRSRDYQDCARLAESIAQIANAESLFRCKGLVHESGSKAHVLVQGVRNRVVHELCETNHEEHNHNHVQHCDQHDRHDQSHSHDYLAELVFIGYHLNREKVSAGLNKLSGSHWE